MTIPNVPHNDDQNQPSKKRRKHTLPSFSTSDKLSEDQQKRYEDYIAEEKGFWNKLREELVKLKKELGTSDIEISQGLQISRQTLVNFMTKDSDSLPISRVKLKLFWDFITDPERIESKKLAPQKKINRQKLRKQGFNELLTLAGFIPENDSLNLYGQSLTNTNFFRITSRLDSPWIRDENSWQIEQVILNEIKDFYYNKNENVLNEETARGWIKQNLNNLDKKVVKKFNTVIANFIYLGKTEFEEIELFELLQSIHENESLRSRNKNIKIRIINCDFRTLTSSLEEFTVNNKFKSIVNQIWEKGNEVECKLRLLSEDSAIYNCQKSSVRNTVKEALVSCRLGEIGSSLSWRYSSNSTHIENMLDALHQGLGYPLLKLSGLSIQALGKQANSLARISVALIDDNTKKKKTYHGLWVDQNTITSILQAVVIAVESWLVETMKNTSVYYDFCKDIASILQNLYEARQALNDYRFNDKDERLGVYSYLENTLQTINLLEKKLPEGNFKINDRLKYYFQMANLMLARSYHIQGKLKEAADHLYRQKYEYDTNDIYTPIATLYGVENIIHKFFSGEPDFLCKKQWRVNHNLNIQHYLEKLNAYIKQKNGRCFNLDLYLCISELYGNFGRLELYFCKENEKPYLEKAVDNFLVAANFSLKIGDMQRVAHWLTHISRVYTRLENDLSKKYVDLANKIVERTILPSYSNEHCEAIQAEVNLAYGEMVLFSLFRRQRSSKTITYVSAVSYFSKALKGSLYLGFVRLIADSLYGLSRAIKAATEQGDIQDIINTKSCFFWKIIPVSNNIKLLNYESPIVKNILVLLNNITPLTEKTPMDNNDWMEISQQLQLGAKKIWHDWANMVNPNNKKENEHPLEEEIESGNFLGRLN